MWTLEQAIDAMRRLEAKLAPHGYHVGLIGSVLTKGKSDKDLDIVVYPHESGGEGQKTPDEIWEIILRELKPDESIICSDNPEGGYGRDLKDVRCTWRKGRRTDFFFLA